MRIVLTVSLFAALLLGGCGRVGSRAVGAISRSAERRAAAVLGRDLERDAASKAIRLRASQRVFKYMTKEDSEKVLENGFRPRTHFTSHVSPGRPLSRTGAAARYGLRYEPDQRLTVTLPTGTIVKRNKVIGGAAGYGELRVEHSLPSDVVNRTTELKHPR